MKTLRLVLVIVWTSAACAPQLKRVEAPSGASVEFWREPTGRDDLYFGVGGQSEAPDPDTTYTLLKRDESGFSTTMDVRDGHGKKWSAKIGPEATTEVIASRIVWAMGYPQPPSYHVFKLPVKKGDEMADEGPARLRPDVEWLDNRGIWKWAQNPFVGTEPYRGLIVLMMILNSTRPERRQQHPLFRPSRRRAPDAVVRGQGSRRDLRRDGTLFAEARRHRVVRKASVREEGRGAIRRLRLQGAASGTARGDSGLRRAVDLPAAAASHGRAIDRCVPRRRVRPGNDVTIRAPDSREGQGRPGARGAEEGLVTETQSLLEAVVRLPLAAVLGAALAMRPRRAGTPPRRPAVVQTQIILAVVGALVMIVVGASLARAFGVVGIAGLVRYRAKIDDPKDAGVMLAALGVGLAAGVGLYWLSPFATLFLLLLLYVLETSEPAPAVRFLLKVTAEDVGPIRRAVEAALRRQHLQFELRSWASGELHYMVEIPLGQGTDAMSKSLVSLGKGISVDWEEMKEKK